MKQKIRRLPDSELEVMQSVWSFQPPVTRGQIEEIIKEKHRIATTTLLTLLSRLSDKGFIKTEKNGRNSVYTPLVSQDEYLARQGNRFFNLLCGGNISTFANALSNSGLTREEISRLRQLLDEDKL